MLNANEVVLPQNQVLLAQLGALERKPSSRGREFIGHPAGSGHHDDLGAAVAVAVTHCVFKDANRPQWWTGSEYFNNILAGVRLGDEPKTEEQYLADFDIKSKRTMMCGPNAVDPVSEETRRKWLDPLLKENK
jgi:hypothetical protein